MKGILLIAESIKIMVVVVTNVGMMVVMMATKLDIIITPILHVDSCSILYIN